MAARGARAAAGNAGRRLSEQPQEVLRHTRKSRQRATRGTAGVPPTIRPWASPASPLSNPHRITPTFSSPTRAIGKSAWPGVLLAASAAISGEEGHRVRQKNARCDRRVATRANRHSVNVGGDPPTPRTRSRGSRLGREYLEGAHAFAGRLAKQKLNRLFKRRRKRV